MKRNAQAIINFPKVARSTGGHNVLTEREVCERAKSLGLYVRKSKLKDPYIYDHSKYKLVFRQWKKVIIAGHEYQLTLEILSEIMDRYEANSSLLRTIDEMTIEDRLGLQVNLEVCTSAIDAYYHLGHGNRIDVDSLDDERGRDDKFVSNLLRVSERMICIEPEPSTNLRFLATGAY